MGMKPQLVGPASLPEVHGTVKTVGLLRSAACLPSPDRRIWSAWVTWTRNWATDLEGGARFGYQLLWVLVMSNAMAILLQTLSARLASSPGATWPKLAARRIPGGLKLTLDLVRNRHRRVRSCGSVRSGDWLNQ